MMSAFCAESYCNDCCLAIKSNYTVFVHYITIAEIQRQQILPSASTNLFTLSNAASSVPCSVCGKSWLGTSRSENWSDIVFVELDSNVLSLINFTEDISVGPKVYKLQAIVHNSSYHFSCAVKSEGNWLHINDLQNAVNVWPSLENLYSSTPRGWFFAVYVLASRCEVLNYGICQDTKSNAEWNDMVLNSLLSDIELPIEIVFEKQKRE